MLDQQLLRKFVFIPSCCEWNNWYLICFPLFGWTIFCVSLHSSPICKFFRAIFSLFLVSLFSFQLDVQTTKKSKFILITLGFNCFRWIRHDVFSYLLLLQMLLVWKWWFLYIFLFWKCKKLLLDFFLGFHFWGFQRSHLHTKPFLRIYWTPVYFSGEIMSFKYTVIENSGLKSFIERLYNFSS